MHPNVQCSTVYNSQDMEATLNAHWRMNKENVVNIYNEILLSHKKEQNNAICSNMDAIRDSHTEWSKSVSHKYHVIPLISGTNELLHRKDTNGLGEQTCVCWGGGSMGLIDAKYCI